MRGARHAVRGEWARPAGYARGEDDDGNVVWRKGHPENPFNVFPGGEYMTTAELLERIKSSLA